MQHAFGGTAQLGQSRCCRELSANRGLWLLPRRVRRNSSAGPVRGIGIGLRCRRWRRGRSFRRQPDGPLNIGRSDENGHPSSLRSGSAVRPRRGPSFSSATYDPSRMRKLGTSFAVRLDVFRAFIEELARLLVMLPNAYGVKNRVHHPGALSWRGLDIKHRPE